MFAETVRRTHNGNNLYHTPSQTYQTENWLKTEKEIGKWKGHWKNWNAFLVIVASSFINTLPFSELKSSIFVIFALCILSQKYFYYFVMLHCFIGYPTKCQRSKYRTETKLMAQKYEKKMEDWWKLRQRGVEWTRGVVCKPKEVAKP